MKLKDVSKTLKYKLAVLTAMSVLFVGTAAAEINWTGITEVVDGMATNLIPSFITLVTAAVPLLITMAVVGFIMGFMDAILGMINRFK